MRISSISSISPIRGISRLLFVAALAVSGCVTIHRPALQPTPPPVVEAPPVVAPEPAHASAGEQGRLSVDGILFRREDGSIFPWRGFSDFRLYDRYLAGENIRPLLEERVNVGANLLRVLGMVDSFAHLWPQEHAEYYDKLAPFAALLADYGLRLEFVVFADAQIVMPDRQAELEHGRRVLAAFADSPLVVVEWSNEAFKNLPGADEGDRERWAQELGEAMWPQARAQHTLTASGAYSIGDCATSFPVLDFLTEHSDRFSSEWVRKTKDAKEHRDGFSRKPEDCGGVGGFAGVHVPVVLDEPKGIGDEEGRRTANQAQVAEYAASAQMFSAGSTAHSDLGVQSLSITTSTTQADLIRTWFAAAKWMPVEAQTWRYQRGDNCGDCSGIGYMPLAQWDTPHGGVGTLRTFCVPASDGSEFCVAIDPEAAWQPEARDSYAVAEFGPGRGLVRLTR